MCIRDRFTSAAARAMLLGDATEHTLEAGVAPQAVRPVSSRAEGRQRSSARKQGSIQLDCSAVREEAPRRQHRPPVGKQPREAAPGSRPGSSARKQGKETVHVRLPLRCPFEEQHMSTQQQPRAVHKAVYSAQSLANINGVPRCSPLGRDIGGDTRLRAQQIEAQQHTRDSKLRGKLHTPST
eukprot:TRINITY_DN45909_c0_g1_i1.p1 TRINITY_DN45909_c0_g1~~TRINITY_DN45909_c0_g1_i1.p1  ORF type:complete len:182 (-),score=38.91 TRINITY_DN45909_c0_g1_i1:94-639(-)